MNKYEYKWNGTTLLNPLSYPLSRASEFRIIDSSEWVEFTKEEVEKIIESDELVLNEDVLIDALIR